MIVAQSPPVNRDSTAAPRGSAGEGRAYASVAHASWWMLLNGSGARAGFCGTSGAGRSALVPGPPLPEELSTAVGLNGRLWDVAPMPATTATPTAKPGSHHHRRRAVPSFEVRAIRTTSVTVLATTVASSSHGAPVPSARRNGTATRSRTSGCINRAPIPRALCATPHAASSSRMTVNGLPR